MFEILEHPADIGFRTSGATLGELFANAAVATLSIMGDPMAAEPLHEYPLRVASGDLESLMVDWLNEVLYWFDGRQVALRRFTVTRLGDGVLEATGFGEPRDPERHRTRLIVKAATYHQLRVEEHDGRWVAEVYLDI